MTALYPLVLQRQYRDYLWGGQFLVSWLNLEPPYPEPLAESWQVYEPNTIMNGALAGQTLADVTKTYGADMVGTITLERYGADFPLLAKFLDAKQNLSVQVHPNDEYAHTREAASGFHGKTESWYILHAEPNAQLIVGMSKPTDRETFLSAAENGTVEDLMHHIPVKPGDTVFLPAGTLHAIGAGIVLFEIQQKSDLTYRVYDFGRVDPKTGKGRELHLEKALDVIDWNAIQPSSVPPLPFDAEGQRTLMIACPLFALERWRVGEHTQLQTIPTSFEIFTCISGHARLTAGDNTIDLPRGVSVVLPASLGNYTIAPAQEGTNPELLRVYVPDIERDLKEPLRREQHLTEQRIEQTIR